MQLNEEEKAMLAGEMGEVVQIALQHQIAVGDFFTVLGVERVEVETMPAGDETEGLV